MIRRIYIKNFLLIDELDIELNPHLTVITGETGAGKSLLLGAINLLLGAKADSSTMGIYGHKCIIEGEFLLTKDNFTDLFESLDIDFWSETIIRREWQVDGKTRAFVNDTPVNLKDLRSITSKLVNIHSQDDTLLLRGKEFQYNFLDAAAGIAHLFMDYKNQFHIHKALRIQKDAEEEKWARQQREKNFLQFQFDELQAAGLISGELESIEQEMKVLENADTLKALLIEAQFLFDGENALLQQLRRIEQIIAQAAKIDAYLVPLQNRLSSSYIELKDLSAEIDKAVEKAMADPSHLEKLRERINLLNNLLNKHRLKTIEQLMCLRDEFDEQLSDIETQNHRLEAIQKQLNIENEKLSAKALALSQARAKHWPEVCTKVVSLLKLIGLPEARLSVEMALNQEPDAWGIDSLTVLFSANRGHKPEPLGKTASGGELSRLMLVMKYLMASTQNLPAIIFDEIDSGISGKVAMDTAQLIKEMSTHIQVIAITHLPQMAAKGNLHLKVFKTLKQDKTITHVRTLSESERLEEIAAMISGETISTHALAQAKELML